MSPRTVGIVLVCASTVVMALITTYLIAPVAVYLITSKFDTTWICFIHCI